MQEFEVAMGSVPGTHHKKTGSPNQDAVCVVRNDDVIAGVVCDGCSSTSHSDVGAQLGARFIAYGMTQLWSFMTQDYLWRLSLAVDDQKWFLDRAKGAALRWLKACAGSMGGVYEENVRDCFLFTVMGVLITPRVSMVFSLGDGAFSLNDGWVETIGPFPGNAPPYLGYGLLEGGLRIGTLDFTVHRYIETADLEQLWVGSDGVKDLVAVAEQNVPGREEKVGGMSQFFEDRYFQNPYSLAGRLRYINRETCEINDTGRGRINWGMLSDDTSLIVIRRKAASERSEQAELRESRVEGLSCEAAIVGSEAKAGG